MKLVEVNGPQNSTNNK